VERTGVLIVGGGIAGLATAYWLARAGARVLLLERELAPGAHSSGKSAAILRTLDKDPVLAALARAGGELLRRPPAELGTGSLLDACGAVLVASGQRARELERACALAGPGSATAALAPGALARIAPHLALHPELALHAPADGRIDVEALLARLAAGASAAGCEIRCGSEVRALSRRDQRISGVELADGQRLAADTVVLAAGGWAGRLGQAAGSRVALRPTRRHLLLTERDPGVVPGWPIVWVEDEGFYARVEQGGMLWCACDEDPVDPDACRVEPSFGARIAERAARLFPALARASAARLWCGIRTLSADGRFALGPDPDLAGLFWVAGLGGHGMSAGLELGRLAAALLAGQALDPGLAQALDPARLALPAGRERLARC
jgi:D-arginine dehydrogenase